MLALILILWLAALLLSVVLLTTWLVFTRILLNRSPAGIGSHLRTQLRPWKVLTLATVLTCGMIAVMATQETLLTRRGLLRSAAASDRLVVRTGGHCHRQPEREATLYETREVSVLRDVTGRLAFTPELVGVHCRCCGDITFEFYRGDGLQTSFSVHHKSRIRIPGKGDRALSRNSAEALLAWMTEVGITRKFEEFQKRKRETSASRDGNLPEVGAPPSEAPPAPAAD